MTGAAVKKLRSKLGLTQQAFADLLGLSFVTVNRWETCKATPTGLGAVMLELLDNVLRSRAADVVHRDLRAVGSAPLALVRALVKMESIDADA